MTKNNHHSNALLLADIIKNPNKNNNWHFKKENVDKDHGFTNANDNINAFLYSEVFRDKFPNFFRMGFSSQAFVDLKLSKVAVEEDIKKKLHQLHGIITIYTVFGEVDLRCKVVGTTPREIEQISMKIRRLDGVESSTTNIVVDDTNYQLMIENWSELIKDNRENIEDKLSAIVSEYRGDRSHD